MRFTDFPRTVRALALASLLAALTPSAYAQTTDSPTGSEEGDDAAALVIGPATISYQGVLTDGAGTPVPNGSSTITIRLFTVATGGFAVYTETHTTTTTGGVFAVEVGAGTPALTPWSSVQFDQSYWLETAVGGTTLSPRTKLLAVPYARSLTPGARIGAPTAGSALTAAGLIESTASGFRFPDGSTQTTAGGAGSLTLPFTGTSGASGYLFNLTGTGATSRGIQSVVTGATGVRGESASAAGSGVEGHATSATGTNFGGFFRSASTSGRAVYGQATSGTGSTYGIYGTSASTSGTGVYGLGSAPGGRGVMGTGGTYGGHFESDETAGRGVYGSASASSGTTYGGFFASSSTSGTGVYGIAGASTGTVFGVYGASASTSGRGVYGRALNPIGTNYGGYFEASSPNGTAVYGTATATSGTPYGVIGRSAGTSGRGVYGEATGSTGLAVQGVATATSGINYGGYFQTSSTSGRGLVGSADAASGITYGGYFFSGSAAGYGLYAINGAGGLAARVAGTSRFDNRMEFFDGADLRIRLDVDEGGEAPAIKLLRGGVTVLELDADHNGDSRVITQELEITGGSDLAEHFDVAPLDSLGAPLPGMVVSIDANNAGRLTVSATAYDRLVAGVVSGAGDVETGLLMGQRGSIADGDTPVALVGRVYVLVDADRGAVRPGDLLTTSDTPGHAMVAADRNRSAGAVIGKAMTSLTNGRGLVLVLVGLQ